MLDFVDYLLIRMAIEDDKKEANNSTSGHSSESRLESWLEEYEEAKKEKGWKAYTGCLFAFIFVLLLVLDCSGVI